MWPGWIIPEGRAGGSFHALLGDGPIFIGLYKQSTVSVHRLGDPLEPIDLMVDQPEGSVESYEHDGKISRWIDHEYYIAEDKPCILAVDGWRIEVRFTHEDNYYIYARVEQPDGAVWHGWSGYGVGAGLEDCGYGYDTREREETMLSFWPDAILEVAAP